MNTPALPGRIRYSPTVDVERSRVLSGSGPVSDAGQEDEVGVELLLNCRRVLGVTRLLVR